MSSPEKIVVDGVVFHHSTLEAKIAIVNSWVRKHNASLADEMIAISYGNFQEAQEQVDYRSQMRTAMSKLPAIWESDPEAKELAELLHKMVFGSRNRSLGGVMPIVFDLHNINNDLKTTYEKLQRALETAGSLDREIVEKIRTAHNDVASAQSAIAYAISRAKDTK